MDYQEWTKEKLITNIKLLTEKLEDSDKQSRVWLEHSPVCTKILDLDYNLQYMSRVGIKELGIKDITEFYGKPYPLDFCPEDFKKEMITNLDKTKETGEITTLEAAVLDLDNNKLWFHSTIVPVNDDEYRIKYIIVVSSNITEQKLSEQKLIKYTNELEKKSLDLDAARQKAESANQAKSLFLANMSHELRTPMNAVLGFAQMMQLDPRTSLSDIQNEHIDSILEGGNHLLNLINEILDLSKIEADHFTIKMEEIKSNEVMADAVLMTKTLCSSRNIAINDQFSAGKPMLLLTDRIRFKQCLLNLLSNAVKYNNDGGSITVVGDKTADGFLRLSLTDTGIGIAAKDYKNVFQMFQRLNKDPTIAEAEGTGIGLSVTKLLIEKMDGRIGFDSEEGIGSTFWIELPLASNQNTQMFLDTVKESA